MTLNHWELFLSSILVPPTMTKGRVENCDGQFHSLAMFSSGVVGVEGGQSLKCEMPLQWCWWWWAILGTNRGRYTSVCAKTRQKLQTFWLLPIIVHVDRVVLPSDSDHMSSRILAWTHFWVMAKCPQLIWHGWSLSLFKTPCFKLAMPG